MCSFGLVRGKKIYEHPYSHHGFVLIDVEPGEIHPVVDVALLGPVHPGLAAVEHADLWTSFKVHIEYYRIITMNTFVINLVAYVHVRGAALLAAAPLAVLLAVAHEHGGDLARDGRVHELVHERGDGRVQDERHEEEEGEDAHDAEGAKDQGRVVLERTREI